MVPHDVHRTRRPHAPTCWNFPGINYRAEIWLNGHLVADSTQIVGMYIAHELDVARWIEPGEPNTLAVKVTPERALQDIDGVELADSWCDWINWNYLGYQGPDKNPGQRQLIRLRPQCGYLETGVPARSSGAVALGPPTSTPNCRCREPIPRG